MDVPEKREVLLGMSWFSTANPDVDWSERTVRPRSTDLRLAFQQCVQPARARTAGGSRRSAVHRAPSATDQGSLNYIHQHGYLSARGMTRLVSSHRLKKLLRASDNEFCFFITAGENAEENASVPGKLTWENLVDNPVYPLAIRYKDSIFRSELPSVPPTRFTGMEATIELNDDVPVHRKQYPLSAAMREAIRAWTQEMVAAKIIRPSNSPYCAPTFCVRKANGEWRIVHDFRGINAKMRVPANPIPLKDDIYRAMAQGRVFSAMDLLWGFYQVRLREDSIPFTAFATPDGLYEYLVTPMGVSSSPSCFNRLVQHIFADQQDFCRTYFDDIFVFTPSDSIDDHLAALEQVFERCKEQQLFIKLSKCTFCAEEIPCLGDRIGRDGVRMDPAKTELIRNWPVPQTKHELQSFLGTCVYVLRFCPDFAELSVPLIELTKGKGRRDPVVFEEEHTRVFNELNDFAVGGYLFQLAEDGSEKFIAYGGRKLSKAEVIYPTREKELLAALHAMRLWKVYLLDSPFFINTDHKTIESLLTQQTCSQRLARWLNELSLFQPRFRWVAGNTNVVADTISRNPLWSDRTSRAVSLQTVLQALTTSQPDEEPNALLYQRLTRSSLPTRCRRGYLEDPYFAPILRALGEDNPQDSRQLAKFSLEDGLLYFQVNPTAPRRLCIPTDKELRNQLLFEEHDAVTRGHPGQHKTRLLMAAKFFWPRMFVDIQAYVASCERCQRNKLPRGKRPGHLHTLDIPDRRWSDISMDFLVQLPETQHTHFDSILVIVDRLTKRAHFLPTRTDATAKDIAQLFCSSYQKLHGLPRTIVSDRDVKFTSKLWSGIMQLQDTQLRLSSAFQPATDGQSEVTNKFVLEFLRHFIGPHQTDWDHYVHFAEFAYNSRPHASIGMSPFEADLGYQPRSVLDLTIPQQNVLPAAVSFVDHQRSLLLEAQDAMARAQQRMSTAFDRNRRHQSFAVGDKVLLDSQNLDLAHIGASGRRKLASRFLGPYTVEAVAGPSRYRLTLPPGLRLFPEFHVSLLKPYVHDDDPSRVNRVPRVIVADGSEGLLVRSITGHRRRKGAQQYRVCWMDSGIKPSWEPLSNLNQVRGLIREYLSSLPSTRTTARLQEGL
ncbi:reverse transcriptase [Phytophthora cinnamomi]|uniref:reverse transcriptase n=1 Tax=Phytophthora cinnamomi TaxID=4785 RepID=UPI00355A7AF1|nr:reverse transcriptase [Phytophthora cinnamomi]